MRTLALLILAVSVTLLASAADDRDRQLIGPQAPLFSQALAQVGMSLVDVHVDTGDRSFFGGDKYRLPFFDALMDDPWKISPYTRSITGQLLAPDMTLGNLATAVQARATGGIRLGLLGDPVEPYAKQAADYGDAALSSAYAAIWNGLMPGGSIEQETAAVPKPVRDSAALLLLALPEILRQRNDALDTALTHLGGEREAVYSEVLAATAQEESDDEMGNEQETARRIERLLDEVDFERLNAGATLAAFVAQRMADDLAKAAPELATASFELELETPYGWIELSGAAPDSHNDKRDYLLVIDTGGSDQYGPVAATQSYANPVSVCIDLAGDDVYANAGGQPAFGAGLFGYGILIDAAGNDRYESQFASEGSGIFGTGILRDSGGNDQYSGVASVQGSGSYGTGILWDAAGEDVYNAYQLSQGFGYTLGSGLLLDAAGSDKYVANDTDIRYPSAQSAEHNTSMCQGVGMGRRADYTDGHSWAGGVGLLVDGDGDDTYSCAVFGQGCAYWYGVGMLVDKAGADQYDGMWYVQGADAHFSLAVLQDDSGDDQYRASMNMAQGAGHDFSLGWLEDSAGNDSYSAPNLSLGGANANGIGIFWDKAGDDSYLSQGCTLGAGGGIASPSVRLYMLNLGIFVDGGGTDAYWQNMGAELPPQPWDFAGDGRAWSRAPMSDPPGQREFGVGIDAP